MNEERILSELYVRKREYRLLMVKLTNEIALKQVEGHYAEVCSLIDFIEKDKGGGKWK